MLDIDLKNIKGPYLIHCDVSKTSSLIKPIVKNSSVKIDVLNEHMKILSNCFGIENLIFPSFNYDFPHSRKFDVLETISQVGRITNYVLNNRILDRTKTPIFSFLTKIKSLISQYHEYPFLNGSVFDYIFKNDGTIIFYGTQINSCTFIHFIESQFGPPVYRYDKSFYGEIIEGGNVKNAAVRFHVRPLGMALEYDWDLLFRRLMEEEVIIYGKNCNSVFAIKARDLFSIWGDIMKTKPLALLNESSRIKVDEKLQTLGRRFELLDFERQ